MLERTRYWDAARELFRLPDLSPPHPCPISASYQAVRNAAAARALANGRQAVFALLYDENNPYFRRTGNWPGWPHILEAALAEDYPDFRFRALSWQRLAPLLPMDESVSGRARSTVCSCRTRH